MNETDPLHAQREAFATALMDALLPLGLSDEHRQRLARHSIGLLALPRHHAGNLVFQSLWRQGTEAGQHPHLPCDEIVSQDMDRRVSALAVSDRQHLMRWCLEAAFAAPHHGGNPDGSGWRAIGYQPRSPRALPA